MQRNRMRFFSLEDMATEYSGDTSRRAPGHGTLSRMRVGFDTSPLCRPHPPGIVRVVRETMCALEERGNLDIVRLAPDDGVPVRRWRQSILPRTVGERDLVGVHSFLSAFPWRGAGRRVQTIHELPWKHGVAENAGWRHRLWASWGARRADAVIVATERVARDLGRRLAIDGGNVHLVPWGVAPHFNEEAPAGTLDEPLLARYRLPDGPLAICLGANRPKKNLAAVLHGLEQVHQRGAVQLHLVISGADSPQLRKDLGLVSRLGLTRWVSTPGEIPEEDLPGLLRLAAVVPVLSRSEGFGLPALEALACGTPVVVSAGSAQSEVAGSAGIEVDPDDPGSVADGFERAVATREAVRYSLPEHVAPFRWERTAEAIEKIWERLAR